MRERFLMKYEMTGRTLNGFKPVLNRRVTIEELQDAIVPDSMPDIERIVGCPALAFIREREVTSSGVRISGSIRCEALYTAQENNKLYSIGVSLPFSYLFEESKIDPQSVVLASAQVVFEEARDVNPRKISVKSSVSLLCRAFSPTEEVVHEGIKESEGIEYLAKQVFVSLPISAAAKSFTINDTVELPSNKAGIDDLLYFTASVSALDYKLIQNKAVIKGTLDVRLLYTPVNGEAPAATSFELPFSQIIDMVGVDENCSLDLSVMLLGADITPQDSDGGAGKTLDVGFYLEAQTVAARITQINPIVDAYSVSHPFSSSTEMLVLADMIVGETGRVPVRESFECGRTIKSVLSLDVSVSPVISGIDEGENVLDSTAAVLVIYIGDDGGIYSCTRQIGVVFAPSDDYSDTGVRTGVEDVTYAINPSGGLDMKFTALFSPVATAHCENEVITNLETDAGGDVSDENAPSVVLRYPRKNESIWEIAKQHRTTIGAIQSANGLEPAEFAPEGRLLLIPKTK